MHGTVSVDNRMCSPSFAKGIRNTREVRTYRLVDDCLTHENMQLRMQFYVCIVLEWLVC